MDSEPLDFIKKNLTKGSLRKLARDHQDDIIAAGDPNEKNLHLPLSPASLEGFFPNPPLRLILNADTRLGWPLQITFVGL